jgi:hypothetical protein
VNADNPRLLALRLACLNDIDRQWVYAQLAPAEVARLKALIADLQGSGLLRDRDALRQVLAERPAAVAAAEQGSALATLLDRLDKPVWRALVLQYLGEKEGSAVRAQLMADNPLLFRQLESMFAAQTLPAGWKAALERLVTAEGASA